MNRVLELTQQKAALYDEAGAILKKAGEENRALTTEEQAAFDGKSNQMEAITKSLDIEQRFAAMGNAFGDGHTSRADERALPKAGGRAQIHNNREDEGFKDIGDFMLCVRSAAIQPSSIDPRLQKRAALGANEKVGVEGGFLVGTDVGNLDDLTHDVGVLAPLCREVPISSNANSTVLYGVDETSRADGSRFGGVQAYWADEASSVTATKPKWRRIQLTLNKLMATFYATEEVLMDASVLAAEATAAYNEEMSFKLDDAIIRGTGSGQPLGVLNSPVLVSVAKETAQAAATVQYENIVKMYARMPARSKRSAVWFVNDDTMPQLQLMTLAIGTAGVPVYLPPGAASEAPYGTIMGRPVIPIEQCATVGTVGDIIFADLSQYKLATKGGIQQASSIHVAFLTAENVFRFMYRVDGQPARSTPMTPFKGSSTLSPFVVLATR